MDPDRYYEYSDFKTMDIPSPLATDTTYAVASEEEGETPEALDTIFVLDQLNITRPGTILAVGFGTPLRNVVRAAKAANIEPLFVTGTEDKHRGFTFGGSVNVVHIGKRFDEKLFTNEYAVLTAARSMGARTVLWINKQQPSNLLRAEAKRQDILLLSPANIGQNYAAWKWELPDTSPEAALDNVTPIVWSACPHCGFTHSRAHIEKGGWICPTCGKLYRMTSDERIASIFDANSFQELGTDIEQKNPLDYPGFDDVIARACEKSGFEEGIRTGIASLEGIEVAAAIMEPTFMMASMGYVVGEKLTRLIEQATAARLPLVIFCASGGARMQEGLVSLMQMAKVSAALEAHDRAGLLFISVITDPTTGGVTASFATLGDIILAEPGALFGFAGRRVIQDTIKQTLPDDFQSAEFALEHGLIDAIVERHELRSTLGNLLRLSGYEQKSAHTGTLPANAQLVEYSKSASATAPGVTEGDASAPLADSTKEGEEPTDAESTTSADAASENAPATFAGFQIPAPLKGLIDGIADLAGSVGNAVSQQTSAAGLWWALRNQSVPDAPGVKPATHQSSKEDNPAWVNVQLARNPHRPTSLYYIRSIVDGFIELHGDRTFADDRAIVGGLGTIDGKPVTIIAEEKGADLKSRIAHNFGSPEPEGYRKAMRLMLQAQKFGRPIVCFVDTQGAFCGKEAEERGMGGAISESLKLLAGLTVPVVAVILGEGGSGGALALAVANRVAMLEHAVYSVLSPEGFASILWKDGSRAPEAAAVMKMSAADACAMGIIEDVIPEGQAPAHENPDQAAAAVWVYIADALNDLEQLSEDELREQRYRRFRAF